MKGFLILVAMPSEQIFSTKKKLPFSEKATNFCEISTVHLSYILTVKNRVEILQNFVAFTEYMNLNTTICRSAQRALKSRSTMVILEKSSVSLFAPK